jgi:hypothetical protein
LLVLTIPFAMPAQQPAARDTQALSRQIAAGLEPLKGLNSQQMAAVAALVQASRYGLNVDQYCPPLRQLERPSSFRCFDAMVSYAMAERECKSKNVRDCPQLLEAEANWASCEFGNLRALVADFPKLGLPRGPRPDPRAPR